jgi:hypothetical protein
MGNMIRQAQNERLRRVAVIRPPRFGYYELLVERSPYSLFFRYGVVLDETFLLDYCKKQSIFHSSKLKVEPYFG